MNNFHYFVGYWVILASKAIWVVVLSETQKLSRFNTLGMSINDLSPEETEGKEISRAKSRKKQDNIETFIFSRRDIKNDNKDVSVNRVPIGLTKNRLL